MDLSASPLTPGPPPVPSQEKDLRSIVAMVTMLGELLDCASHLLPAQSQKPAA